MPESTDMVADQATADDGLPDPDPEDAWLATVRAARKDGVIVQRGAYQARRRYVESNDIFRTFDPVNVVVLRERAGYGGDAVGVYPVRPFHVVRDDWEYPPPDDHDPSDWVLPPWRYDLDDVFVNPAALPGDDGE